MKSNYENLWQSYASLPTNKKTLLGKTDESQFNFLKSLLCREELESKSRFLPFYWKNGPINQPALSDNINLKPIACTLHLSSGDYLG